MMHSKKRMALVALAAVGLVAAGYFLSHKTGHQPLTEWRWQLPAHFPQPRVPADNAMSVEKFELGRHLFYDKRLSGNGTYACASCHFQHLAFTDGKAVATGSTGEFTARSAQGLANSVYHTYYTWANYSLASMERQMINPLAGERPVEMGLNDGNQQAILQRFRDDPDYVQRFGQVFPDEEQPITIENIIKAISAFQRGLISANSRYDQHLQRKIVLTEAEERGKRLFFSEQAQCSQCHGSFNFNDQVVSADTQDVAAPFHNTGLYNLDANGSFPYGNRGLFEISDDPRDMGMFRAPSLRNVAVTAPYMHDGTIATLEDVLDFYAAHGRVIAQGPYKGDGRRNPHKDARIDKIRLSRAERRDIVAFLRTLTDESFLADPRYADPFKSAR